MRSYTFRNGSVLSLKFKLGIIQSPYVMTCLLFPLYYHARLQTANIMTSKEGMTVNEINPHKQGECKD
jgi:hypothetical protein